MSTNNSDRHAKLSKILGCVYPKATEDMTLPEWIVFLEDALIRLNSEAAKATVAAVTLPGASAKPHPVHVRVENEPVSIDPALRGIERTYAAIRRDMSHA